MNHLIYLKDVVTLKLEKEKVNGGIIIFAGEGWSNHRQNEKSKQKNCFLGTIVLCVNLIYLPGKDYS